MYNCKKLTKPLTNHCWIKMHLHSVSADLLFLFSYLYMPSSISSTLCSRMDHLTNILKPAQTNNKYELIIQKQINSHRMFTSLIFRNNIFFFLADRITV